MLAIKLCGACLLALSGWFAGAAICERATAHCIALSETLLLLKTLEEEISCRRANLNVLYLRFVQENRFPNLAFSQQRRDGQPESLEVPQGLFSALSPPVCFTAEERKAFSACFTRIGHAGAQQECEQLARYHQQFEMFYQRATKAEREALAIDRKMGLALGSMVAIILL